MRRRTLGRWGVTMLTVGIAIVLLNVWLLVFHPGEPSPWDNGTEVVRLILARDGLLPSVLSDVQSLALCGAGVALVLGGLILLAARASEAEASMPGRSAVAVATVNPGRRSV